MQPLRRERSRMHQYEEEVKQKCSFRTECGSSPAGTPGEFRAVLANAWRSTPRTTNISQGWRVTRSP
jgi:hypothetical protein